jgi:hypothetical protein
MISNRSIEIGKRAIPIWILVAAIVGAGSLAIAVQPVSDEKIHLQDVDGKIHTNVPVAASRAFSPLPVEFDEEGNSGNVASITGTGVTGGSQIVTKQKVVVNLVLPVSNVATVKIDLDNDSEDAQIFLIKAGAPSNVILDMESEDVTIHGLTGHNEWLASITAAGNDREIEMEVSTTDAGFYPIVVELLRVG